MVGIDEFRVFMKTRLNIEPYSPLKPTKVGFVFIGPNYVTQAVVKLGRRLGLKVGLKKLRL